MTNPTLNKELKLFVTNLDADGPLLRIWAQPDKDNGERIERIMYSLSPQFDNGLGCPKPQSRGLIPNVICCAMFERAYYRAKICSIHHTGGIVVQFLDYGNIEILKPNDIRLLDGIPEATELQRIPPLAVEYIVANVLSRGNRWEGQVLGEILKNIRYSTYPGQIIGAIGKYRLVRMLYCDQDFSAILVSENMAISATLEDMYRVYESVQQTYAQQAHAQQSQIAISKVPMQIPLQHPPCDESMNHYAALKQITPLRVSQTQHYQDNWHRMQHPQQLQHIPPTSLPQMKYAAVRSDNENDIAGGFRTRMLEIGSKYEINVSCVEDGPLMFCVQVKSSMQELNDLMYYLNNTHVPQPLVEPPAIGAVCLARYTNDNTLLRAVVGQVREHDCKVHYIDYGHIEILPYTEIYQLPRQFIKPRAWSIRLTMSNVNEIRVNNEMKEYFKNYVKGKTFLLHVRPSEGSPLIQYGDLYDNGRSVKEILRGIFGDAISEWPSSCALPSDSRDIVQVVYVEQSIIFVQLDSDAPLLESMTEHIAEYVKTAPPFKPNQLQKGLQCIALSSADSQWYRAEIVGVSGDTVTVFYVDYGNEETIPTTAVRSIRDNTITKLRAQAIRCILNDYDKEITTKAFKESLETEILAGTVAMKVTKITADGPIVDLYDPNTDPLVNIIHRLKRASVVNGNADSKTDIYNDRNTNSARSNMNRSDDQTNRWNNTPRSEPPRIADSNNLSERGKSNSWKEDENGPRRYDNRYQNRDRDGPPNSGQQQSDRVSRNDGKNDRFVREGSRYERNERYDRFGDSNANTRGGRDNRERGGHGGFGNGRYSGNNSRTERNISTEKAWSDKDSDTSSRGSGRSGRRGGSGGRGSGGKGRRDGVRTSNTRDNEGDSDRGGFKNARTNGASSRIRDFSENHETKQFDNWTNKTAPILSKVNIPLPNITVGVVKNCERVYSNGPTDFYVQLSPDYLELDHIMASIATTYENGGKIIDRLSIKEGLDCVAQYSEDERWYRASVQSIEANGATVRFVDYGNVETVEFTKIKELEADYAKLSAQAIACKLLAADKTTWTSCEIEKFDKLTDLKCLEAEFVAEDNNVFEILLREIIDDKASSSYVNEEFSDGADLKSAKNNARYKGSRKQEQVVVSTDYASIDDKWLIEDMRDGSKENLIITWFTNPDNFYCQRLSKKDEFRAMMDDIQKVYANRQPINEPLQVGSAVMAIFSDDGALYRAEILELNKPRGNVVRYVDFGNKAMVEQRSIYRVEKKFMNLPKQAVNCSLKNIVPSNGSSWAKSNRQDIEKCFDGENFECTFHENKDGKYIISLNNGGLDVAGTLVEKSLASFAVSAHVHAEPNEPEVKTTETSTIEELPRFDISLLAGQILRVKVSNVASAAKFHIQLPSANASEEVIDAYMAQNDPQVMPRLSYREVCLGAGCLVNTDEGWRRAVVVNCSRTTGFDVRLIDTGANDEIPLDCMLALPGELSVMQNQAVECCLKNATTNIVLDEKLRDTIENSYVIVAVEEVDNNRLIVKLYDTNGKNIKLDADEEDENICPICPMPILYSTQKVAVAHAEHSSSVWLKRTLDLDEDTKLLSELYDHYSVKRENEKPALIVAGKLCAAKSTDENWYRAKILRTTETGTLVQYIDYGNNEDISDESLRFLEPQFYAQPQLAIEVALTVTLAGSMDQQQAILKSLIVNEEFTATMYNVHKKWVAELTNADGKISEKLANLETVEVSKTRRVETSMPEMIVGERYKVACTHANDPASFWLQRNEEIAAIEELQDRLQIEATNCPNLVGIPEENTLCLAMYSADDTWYRAEVIDADKEITTIRFIDFGNTDIVYTNQGRSKKITDSLKSIKRYAVKCRLDVIPYGAADWTMTACEWFEATATSSDNMEALVIADSAPRRVELFVGETSLVDELVKRNYATRINTEEDLIEEIIEREVDPRAAYVSHAISPNEFWIQQEKYVGDLEILADRFIVADMFPKPKIIDEGLLCVAKFPEDESWYRGRVLSHADTGTEVIYIDYGNSAVSTEIREIPKDVAEQPAFSKKCRLAMPEGLSQWSEEACVEFVKMAADGATIFQLDVLEDNEDTSIVRLTREGKDIVENLTNLCTPEVIVIEERLTPLGEENSPNVVVSHVNSPSDFYTQAESSINELEDMVVHLATAESFFTLENIEEGTICAAKFPEDEQWYRAKILSHGDAGYEVLYTDYGNSAITTELRVLPEDIVKIPALSTCCSLRMPENIDSWSREACEKFFELVNEGVTMFQYELLENKEQTIVRLCIDGKDIVDTLAPLCQKIARHEEITNLVSEEKTKIDETQQEIVVNIVNGVENCTETSNTQRATFTEECTSSDETSGIDIITTSDTSTVSDVSKLETSTETSTTRISKSKSQEAISEITASTIGVLEISTSANDIDEVMEITRIEKIVKDVSNIEKVSDNIDNTVEEVTSVEKIIEKVSNVDQFSENLKKTPRIENSDEKISENKELLPESNEHELTGVDKDLTTPKTLIMEKILPGTISRGLSENDIILDQIERRNSMTLEDKIVSGNINKGEDLTLQETTRELSTREVTEETSDRTRIDELSSPIVARKLSFGDNSSSYEHAQSTTPKTPHSEKIVAGVVTLQEKLDDLEKDEILTVATE